MAFDLEELLQKVQHHPDFEKAKKVKEIGDGHPEESVAIHLLQTSDYIKDHVNGDFITNPQAKKLFQEFMNRKIEGVKYADIAILIGLIHDIGKTLSYKEEGKIFSINVLKPGGSFSHSPNHGYYGSILATSLLQEIEVEPKIVDYVAKIIHLHLVPFDYYRGVADYSLKDAIDDLKPRMEGLHVEVCLNAYGDIAYNPPLHTCWELLGQMLSEPHFYSQREYFVA